ncbi:hypothetical protein G5B88_01030 [Herbaspirillum seropedicae]|uniref:hypothetical protein n=1 Tax=Herbaspirillum seropedicae TaxID=964 RepID=UPI000309CDFC|nr:hypothetical protein [Herbaspirillum seropedicae]AKN63938.1 hypothetical protein ACP92_01025 [Herbaspirillum seropedicae]NQE29309.1 hypothetical protein [Herbaspirillum seropedicae]UMU19848.1 hypothetical protein G5B88_01030 [Herbaspirillum seropedicae]
MSLEQQLTEAIASQNALTQMVANKMGSLDARINGFVDRWGVDGYTVLEVGRGKPYATIADAWYALSGKAIKSDILIKVADGDYASNQIWLSHQPFGSRIRIEGNLTNPQNCILRMTPATDRYSHGVVLERQYLAGFSGFTIVGTQTADHWTHRGLFLGRHSDLYCMPGTLRFEQCGVEVASESFLDAKELRINDCRGNAVTAHSSGTALVEKAVITGPSHTAQYTRPDGSIAIPHGMYASGGAHLWCGRSRISNVRNGAFSDLQAYVLCSDLVVDTADIAFLANVNGVLHAWSQADAAECTKAINVRVGYQAWAGGVMYALGSAVQNAAHGYYASENGFIHAGSSRCINVSSMGYNSINGSQINAGDTGNRFVNTPNRYNLPAYTLGASNAFIYY